DLGGAFVAPGLIDAHMHIESSLLTPRRFAEAVIPHGTTTLLADAHEVGNVAGEAGITWMVQAGNDTPMRIFHALPSCVPATSPEIESTAQVFGADEIERMLALPRVIALGEVMDYRGLLGQSARLPPLVAAARRTGVRIEGHIPTLTGMELSEYLSHGVQSDHTLTFPAKILEQLTKGVTVMLQAKSLTPENMACVNALADRNGIVLVTDDVEPNLLREGHLTRMIGLAVKSGLAPIEALASATIRPARYMGIHDLGGIAPGYLADFIVLDDLAAFPPRQVWVGGRTMAENGKALDIPVPAARPLPEFPALPGPMAAADFRLLPEAPAGTQQRTANAVVVVNQTNSITRLEPIGLRVEDGLARFAEGDGLSLVAVFARRGGARSVGVIKNVGIDTGAAATSMAHDSHNLLVVGRDVAAMARAANAVFEMGGGVVVDDGSGVVAELRLPVFSLISDARAESVAAELDAVEVALRGLGMKSQRPFLQLSLLALSVSPYYKFSDKGVVDTEARALLPAVL
ncbi:MAG: adenine deaminase C-terminal domain-containing protein, partial [Thermoflexales bacterium]